MAVSTHEHIHNILNEVWSIFNSAGVSEDLIIIESIAAFLLEIEQKRLVISQLQPRKPELNENVAESIKRDLIIACDLAQSAGKLFDRYVLFQLSVKPAKNTYPIPRHIVQFMVQIVNISTKHTFADFSCGSGGFFVHGPRRSASNVGVDIAPEWIRIAAANIRLHITSEIKLYTDDAFHICNQGELSSQSFDRIAMVPPFGITIDSQVALQTMGVTSGRASEILFIRLALKKLNEQGRAVVMLPDTLLMKRGSQQLRKEILERHTLLAVISLGEGVLYPFDPQSVTLLLLEKHHNPAIYPWLFNVVNDGYQRRRNRDITQDPSPDHDLAIVESVLHAQSSLQPVPTKNNIPAYFAVAALQSTSQNTFIGFVIQIRVSVKQCSVWLIEEEQPELATCRFLLAHLSISGTSPSVQYIVIPLNRVGMQLTDIRCDDNYTVWLSNRTQMRSGSTIFSHSDEAGMISPTIAILRDGRLLGCTRSAYEITHNSYHLCPMDYLNIVGQRRSLSATELGLSINIEEPEAPLDANAALYTKRATRLLESIEYKTSIEPSGPEIAEDTSPSVALHKLKQQHDLIWRYANYLQGQLEMHAYTDLPPHTQDLSSFELLHYLGEEQRAIWEAIQRMVDNQGHAYYFTIQQLQATLQTDIVQLRSSLELLEQIGVIVHVHINLPGKETTIICYRLLTEYDVIQSKENVHETTQD